MKRLILAAILPWTVVMSTTTDTSKCRTAQIGPSEYIVKDCPVIEVNVLHYDGRPFYQCPDGKVCRALAWELNRAMDHAK